MSMLNVGPTVGSFDKQALETELTQLKDAITSVRIQNDGFKVENVNVKRCYQELSKSNTHSRAVLTGKITALTAENAKLKTELISKISSGPIASEKPKLLAPGMYAISPKPSNRPTQKTVVQQNKKPNIPVNLSTGVKPATGASKPMSKSDTQNHSTLLAKSEKVRRVEDHHMSMNKKNHVDSRLNVKLEPIVEPLELIPCISSSTTVTMISRVTGYKLSDQKAGSKGISGCSRHMTGDRSKLINYVDKFIGTVRFGNDQFAAIVGYGLEVAFRQHTCHIRNKDMVDLLQGSRSTNLYSISLNEMLAASPVCLLTKASSTKSWLWHRRLNHLNFGTLNELARNDLVRGLPMLKYDKDHLCPSCQLGKSKKSSHPLKTVNTNTEILNTLHMDLCGPMRVESINKKKYILVIVDDYTRFGWVRFLRTKDETPEVLKNFIVTTQRTLNATVCYLRTDNGTEFVNKTLTEFF
ncbi:retrovirus-related pol polyprotein from transposon TNT 1-94 [Tanacetum coccineum]